MLRYIKLNYQVLLLYILWMITGIYNPVLSYVIIPLSILILRYKEMDMDILTGFIFIMILDDNIHNELFVFTKIGKQIYILTLAFLFLFNYNRFQPYSRIFILFVPFFISAFLSLFFFSPVLFDSLEKTVSYMLLVLIVPNYLVMIIKNEGSIALRNLFSFVNIILLAGIVMKFISPDFVYIKERFAGLFGNPNGLGIFCTVTFILFELTRDLYPKLFLRYERMLFYFLIILCIVLCGSRAAYLAFLVFFIFRYLRNFPLMINLAIFIFFMIAFNVFFLFFIDIISALNLENYFRMQTFAEGGGRYIAWQFAWKEILNNFFLGRGFHYDVFYFRIHYGELVKMGHEGLVHNSFMALWLDTGIIGLVLFLGAFFSIFLSGLRYSSLALPAMCAITVSGFFETWLSGSLNPFTIFLVLSLALLFKKSDPKKINE